MLLPFTPILAALSQAAPIFKGKLADIDLRWTVISQSVDCRTPEERDPESEKYVPKSRYGTINHYLSNHAYVKDEYNDTV
jgi:glutamate--cysteine ligase catalytic subunit